MKQLLFYRQKGLVILFVTLCLLQSVNAATLNLKLFIQGYYQGGGMMNAPLFNLNLSTNPNDVDTITVSLIDTNTNTVTECAQGILHTDGNCQLTFSANVIGGTYYIVVNHRACLLTSSANPVLFSTVTDYDFSNSPAKAYGNNMTVVDSSVWALYSGDINFDCIINAVDSALLMADVNIGASGYLPSDLNGDGAVEAFDYLLLDANRQQGGNPLHCILPFPFSIWTPCINNPCANVFIDDGIPCTIDACNPFTGVTHIPYSINVSAMVNPVLCNGETTCVLLSASGGAGYHFYSDGNSFNLSGSFCGINAGGPYIFFAVDTNFCSSDTISQMISQPLILQADSITSTPSDSLISSGTATVFPSGGNPPFSYVWSPGGQTGNPAINLASGTYCVFINDVNNCMASACVVVGLIGPVVPANDLICNAIILAGGDTIPGTTINATTTGETDLDFCNTNNITSGGVWYQLTGWDPGNTLTLNTCYGTNFDTRINIFSSNNGLCNGNLNCIAGNDNACGQQSQVVFTADTVPGNKYYALVSGAGNAAGNFTIAFDKKAETPVEGPRMSGIPTKVKEGKPKEYVSSEELSQWIKHNIDSIRAAENTADSAHNHNGFKSMIVLAGECYGGGFDVLKSLGSNVLFASAATADKQSYGDACHMLWLHAVMDQIKSYPGTKMLVRLKAVKDDPKKSELVQPPDASTSGTDHDIYFLEPTAKSYHVLLVAGILEDDQSKGPIEGTMNRAKEAIDANWSSVKSLPPKKKPIDFRKEYGITKAYLKFVIDSMWHQMNDDEQFILIIADHGVTGQKGVKKEHPRMKNNLVFNQANSTVSYEATVLSDENLFLNVDSPSFQLNLNSLSDSAFVLLNGIQVGTILPDSNSFEWPLNISNQLLNQSIGGINEITIQSVDPNIIDNLQEITLATGPVFAFTPDAFSIASGCYSVPSVKFSQVNFNLDSSITNRSDWGVMDVVFKGTSYVQYLNVRVDSTWVFQNLPVLSTKGNDEMQKQRFWFHIGDAGVVKTNINYGLTLTNAPVGIPAVLMSADVEQDSVVIFTHSPGAPAGPAAVKPQKAEDPLAGIDPAAPHAHNEKFPNQKAGNMECVPVGLSNSCKFLNQDNDLGIADNRLSIDSLKKAVNWSPDWPPSKWPNLKRDYMIKNNIPITTYDPENGNDQAFLTNELLVAMQGHQDIELVFFWDEARTKSHCVDVTGVVIDKNAKKIIFTIAEDPNQHDDKAPTGEEVIQYDYQNRKWKWMFPPDNPHLPSNNNFFFLIECPGAQVPNKNNKYPFSGAHHQSKPEAGTSFNGQQKIIKGMDIHNFSGSFDLPPAGATDTIEFTGVASLKLSLDSGITFQIFNADATYEIKFTNVAEDSTRKIYHTEVAELSITGGNLPLQVKLRESMVDTSKGLTIVNEINDSSFTTISFFDVFFEASFDSGATWSPADFHEPTLIELTGGMPEIICPDSTTACAVTGQNFAETENINLGTPVQIVTGLSNILKFANDIPRIFPLGYNTVNWTAIDGFGNSTTCKQIIRVEECGIILNVNLFIEGYYIGNGQMKPVIYNGVVSGASDELVDTMTLELHDSVAPYNLIYSASGIIDIFGNGRFEFPAAVYGKNYYLAIRYRNAIETWSKYPVLFNSDFVTFDFTR